MALFYLRVTKGGKLASIASIDQSDGNILLRNDISARLISQLPGRKSPIIPEFLPATVARAFEDAENSFLAGHWNQSAASFRKAVDRAISPMVAEDEQLQKNTGLARLWWRAFSSLPGPFARRRWGSG
ncbi:hypothetical protein QKW60_15120, partial [Defluviimonas aestuarii]|uniref:hypothetical protein n=1 Tax=Albidovulum aestuarii TaxID=1130726 RepID=UPI00249B2E7E